MTGAPGGRRKYTVAPRCDHPMRDGGYCGKRKGHTAGKHASEEAWERQLEHRHRKYLESRQDAATAAEEGNR